MKKRIASFALALVLCLGLCVPALAYPAPDAVSGFCSQEEWDVLVLVNQQRLEQGLRPLSIFPKLQSAADIREEELAQYYSHTRPDGSSCFTVLKQAGLSYVVALENIASGQQTPEEVMDSWMNSPGHRANILNSSVTHIGVGFNRSGGLYGNSWVQLFMNTNCWIQTITPSQDSVVCPQGGKLEDLGIYLTTNCSVHGTSYYPLLSAMCPDFDSSVLGTQIVTVRENDRVTTQLRVEVVERQGGSTDPGPIQPDPDPVTPDPDPVQPDPDPVQPDPDPTFPDEPEPDLTPSYFHIDGSGTLTSYTGPGGDVVVPDSVKKIGQTSFWNCAGVTSVTLPATVTEISPYAFQGCTGLAQVNIPDSVRTIGVGAFQSCISLTALTIPDQVTSIGEGAFARCTGLKRVTIGSGIREIAPKTFQDCTALTSVVFPNGLTQIGKEAFLRCSSLKSITIHEGVTQIGDYAFAETGLTSVTIPGTVAAIAPYSFSNCASLTEVVVHEGVAEIGVGAFFTCRNLIRATLPASAAKIEMSSFSRCPEATIYAPAKSRAEVCARYNGLGFVATDAEPDPEPLPSLVFTDVPEWFRESVAWAVEEGITNGTSETTFSPKRDCSAAHIFTFLWRAGGRPQPTIADPFTGLNTDDYYYYAAIWANEKGLIPGGTFHANDGCTRAMVVTYLWKLSGSPRTAYDGRFDDVSADADYAQAVAWASARGITEGTSPTTFSPDKVCNRGEIVTFLYRYHTD